MHQALNGQRGAVTVENSGAAVPDPAHFTIGVHDAVFEIEAPLLAKREVDGFTHPAAIIRMGQGFKIDALA